MNFWQGFKTKGQNTKTNYSMMQETNWKLKLKIVSK